ncbi:Hypothetical protein FKW44_008313, partial [Caligus rogercresseyi]
WRGKTMEANTTKDMILFGMTNRQTSSENIEDMNFAKSSVKALIAGKLCNYQLLEAEELIIKRPSP